MSSLKLLNQHSEWVTWVRENLARGCDLNSVVDLQRKVSQCLHRILSHWFNELLV